MGQTGRERGAECSQHALDGCRPTCILLPMRHARTQGLNSTITVHSTPNSSQNSSRWYSRSALTAGRWEGVRWGSVGW